MRNLDLTPLSRSTVGFDLLDDSLRWTGENNYPPYNIERTGEDQYQISLALAGFAPEDIAITAEQNTLTVEGRKADKSEHQYLYHGISARPFRRQSSETRRFLLASAQSSPTGNVTDRSRYASQQNTSTGKLTEAMLDQVFARAREIIQSEPDRTEPRRLPSHDSR